MIFEIIAVCLGLLNVVGPVIVSMVIGRLACQILKLPWNAAVAIQDMIIACSVITVIVLAFVTEVFLIEEFPTKIVLASLIEYGPGASVKLLFGATASSVLLKYLFCLVKRIGH